MSDERKYRTPDDLWQVLIKGNELADYMEWILPETIEVRGTYEYDCCLTALRSCLRRGIHTTLSEFYDRVDFGEYLNRKVERT